MKKVKYFTADIGYKLEEKIDEFAKKNNILQVSFSENIYGYSITYSVLVLYEPKED